MSSRVHPAVVVLALLVALVVVAMVYSRRLQEPPPQTAPSMGMMPGSGAGRRGMRGGGGGNRAGGLGMPELGVKAGPSSAPPGLKVSAFQSSTGATPLQIMGIKEGDVIESVNGSAESIRTALGDAIRALQKEGKPITLVVNRDGKELTLKVDKKLPAAAAEPVLQATPPAGTAVGGKRRGR